MLLKITTLLDNLMSEHKALVAEHGLSLYIEWNDKKILFDFGASDAPLYNAEKIGVKLNNVDFMVCSHAHYDHATGFKDLLYTGIIPDSLYTGCDFWCEKYAFDGIKYTYLGTGFDKSVLNEFSVEHIECDEDVKKLFDGCYIVTNFNRRYDFETIPKRFVRKMTDNKFERDLFKDEVCLVFDTEKGLVVVVGCSHPGILNMLSTISERFGKKIYAVIGGSHLVEADEKRINTSIEEMTKMGVELTAFSHCSGSLINELLAKTDALKNTHMATGDVLVIK